MEPPPRGAGGIELHETTDLHEMALQLARRKRPRAGRPAWWSAYEQLFHGDPGDDDGGYFMS